MYSGFTFVKELHVQPFILKPQLHVIKWNGYMYD